MQNPQLVAQHCFVASFGRCFLHFSPCVINLSRNKNICPGLKKSVAKSRARVYFEQQIMALLLVFHQTSRLTTRRATILLALKQINQSERCISSTRNKCFCWGSSWSCKVKSAELWPKLATKQCCATSWGFLYLLFRRLYVQLPYVLAFRALVLVVGSSFNMYSGSPPSPRLAVFLARRKSPDFSAEMKGRTRAGWRHRYR